MSDPEARRRFRHWSLVPLAVAGVVIGIAVLAEMVLGLPLGEWVSTRLSRPGWPAAATVVGLLAADLFLPVPSSLVMLASGSLFGVWGGTVLGLLGSLAGAGLGYEIARRRGLAACERWVGTAELARMRGCFERYGAVSVFLSRSVPVAAETLAVVAGLGRLRRGTFWAAAVIGTLPVCAIYAWAGARSRDLSSLLPAFFAALLLPAIGWILWISLRSPLEAGRGDAADSEHSFGDGPTRP